MRSVKISTLLKVGMLLVLFSFMGCPKSVDGGQNVVNNAPAQQDIKGDGPANETLKETIWVTKPTNNVSEVELHFAKDSNTCTVNLPISEKFYVAEYEVKENKVTLKLDKNIEFFKNYTVFNLLKGEQRETEEYLAGLKDKLSKATDEDAKKALNEYIGILEKALSDGSFNSLEKFKKFSIEIMLPRMIQMSEEELKNPSISPEKKAKIEASLPIMKEMVSDPSKFETYYINPTIKEAKETATHLSNANPIVLTLPDGQTLENCTTMTANKLYVGVDNKSTPQYKENIEFTKK